MKQDLENYINFWKINKDYFSITSLKIEYSFYFFITSLGTILYSLFSGGISALIGSFFNFNINIGMSSFIGLEAIGLTFLLVWIYKDFKSNKKEIKNNLVKLQELKKLLNTPEAKTSVLTFLIPYIKENYKDSLPWLKDWLEKFENNTLTFEETLRFINQNNYIFDEIEDKKEKEIIANQVTDFMKKHKLSQSTEPYTKENVKQKYLEML